MAIEKDLLDQLLAGRDPKVAELRLPQGFGIEGLKRSTAQPEPFGRLSDGTREQIAVLVRLALGAMLAERGQAVPIILDDALVYSDDERIRACSTR